MPVEYVIYDKANEFIGGFRHAVGIVEVTRLVT